MKAVILAGGYGTRISEESGVRPKPMVEIGGMPILWHIMKIFSSYGTNDFIICCGYKGHLIKEFFANYYIEHSDITIDLQTQSIQTHTTHQEPWKVTLVDTGIKTMTAGRLKRIKDFIGEEAFFMTYGDGVADINLHKLVEFHKSQGVLATVTAIQPPGRYGTLALDEGQTKVPSFREKPAGDGAWVNGGFFVLEPGIFKYIEGDNIIWEQEPMTGLSKDGQLAAYRHTGFWQNMDTLRDKIVLEEMWQKGVTPWKRW